MNMNNYTIKSQEAVQEAVQVAQQKGQQAIETGHLLKGVIAKGENITTFIFNKLGMNGRNVTAALERIVDGYPRVSGGQPYLSETQTRRWRGQRNWLERWATSTCRWNISCWGCCL